MKRIFIVLCFVFVGLVNNSFADTGVVQWYNADLSSYETATCTIGGDIILPTPPTKPGYTFVGWMLLLPDGYTELEYIESTGTQYIDPQVTGDARWVITAQANAIKGSSQSLISSTSSASGGSWYGEFASTGHWDIISGGTNIPSTTKTTADLTFDSDGVRGTIGSTSVDRVASVTQGAWRIFVTTGNSYPFAGKLFDAKVYQGGVLVRNFVPAKDSNNIVGMYDLVSGQFFANQGFNVSADTVTVGEYTDASGNVVSDTQSFQTSVFPVLPNTTYTASSSVATTMLRVCEYNSSKTFIIRHNTALNSGETTLTFTTTANTYYVNIGANVNGSSITLQDVLDITWQIEQGSTATPYDNEVGMYDPVSGQFFTNSGTGDFIAGPVVQ